MKRRITLFSLFLFISVIGISQIIPPNGTVSSTYTTFSKDSKLLDSLFKNVPGIDFKFKANSKLEVDTFLTNIISIDYFNASTHEVIAYANKSQFQKFLQLNYGYQLIQNKAPKAITMATTTAQMASWDRYPTYGVYDTLMTKFQTNYPTLFKRYDLVTLSSGRKLIVGKITANIGTSAPKPQYLWTSSIHGDEITGFVTMLRFINYLLTNYGTNTRVTNILDNIELWVLPAANPDGTYYNSTPAGSTVANSQRGNANGIDMNRNYRDPRTGANPDGNSYQTETQTMMNFADTMHFVMAGNFHGGSEVYNFPWDTWASSSRTAADDAWWRLIGKQFADTVQKYGPLNSISNYFKSLYASGYTEGGDWYVITGGRQDFMNYFAHCREVTIEISATKLIGSELLPNYWNALYLAILRQTEECQYGFRGTVTDACTGLPIHSKIYVNSHDADSSWVWTNPKFGNYYRPILAGTWSVTFSATGYTSQTFSISTTNGTYITKNVALVPTSAVTPNVSIAANPSGTVCSGTSVTFTATPSNGGTPTYLWKLNGNTVGTNSASYSNSSLANGDIVKCIMTSSISCVTVNPDTSNVITMTVTPNTPAVSNIITAPGTVTSANTVSVSSDIADCYAINTVTLKWCTDNSSFSNSITMNLGVAPTYTTSSPIPAMPAGTTVYYKIEALDINTNKTTSPVNSYTVASACGTGIAVFSDDFSRTTLSPGGTPSLTYTSTMVGTASATIVSSSYLKIANGSTSGISYVSGNASSYSSLYKTTLVNNTGLVTWTFNFKYDRTTNPGGITSGTYGTAVVLAGSSSTLTTGTGYAVVYGNGSTPDPIRLVKYSGGAGTSANIITSGVSDISAITNYVSVRVTYNPVGSYWSLYIRDDGASGWADPSTGVTTQIGSTTFDNAYTGTALPAFGFIWSHSNTANATNDVRFDNYTVSVVSSITPSAYAVTGGGSNCGGSSGAVVGLNNSEAGNNYLLYLDGNYTNIQVAGTGSAISFGTQTTNGTYTVTALNPLSGCSTDMTGNAVISINPVPGSATANATQSLCGSATVANLTATPGTNGNTVAWFAASSGGSALSSSTALSNGTTYYAETQNSTTGCVAASRTAVTVTLIALPGSATAAATQSFCGSTTVANLTATPGANGNTVAWFSASSGGSALSSSTALSNGTTYYAESQNSTSGCIAASRTAVAVTINTTPGTAAATASQSFCGSATVANLTATPGTNGNTVAWFAASSGGSALSSSTAITNGTTYYAESQNSNTGCTASLRTAVAVIINLIPGAVTANASQTFCGGTIANLSATPGTNGDIVVWYAAASGGIALSSSTSLVNGTTYYAETMNSVTGCVSSSRTAVTVTVNSTLGAAVASSAQSFCGSGTIADLAATPGTNGNTIEWFDASSGGSALSSSTILINGTSYYAESQNTGTGCVASTRTAVAVTINSLPVIAAIAGNSTIDIGSTTQLSDVTAGGNWSSQNPANASVDVNGLVTGNDVGTAVIVYTVTDLNSCTDSVTITITVDMPTSISTFNEKAISIYSVGNAVYVFTPRIATIHVYNLPGNMIMNKKAIPGINKLQLNSGAGIYIIKVSSDTQTKIQKIMISQ